MGRDHYLPYHPASALPASTCAWCGADTATWWLCERCDQTPFYRGGSRYATRRRWRTAFVADNGLEHGNYEVEIVDKGYSFHTVTPAREPLGKNTRSRFRRAYCRNLNYDARKRQKIALRGRLSLWAAA
jgi:hypothetical protein